MSYPKEEDNDEEQHQKRRSFLRGLEAAFTRDSSKAGVCARDEGDDKLLSFADPCLLVNDREMWCLSSATNVSEFPGIVPHTS